MKTFLDYIRHWSDCCPDKPAVIYDGGMVTYGQLLPLMEERKPLPLPLLGDAWDGDFCLYTTGTTGKSKGVIISQRAVMANSENLIAGQGYHHDLIFIIAGDMHHLGCWSKIFPTLMQGATLLILKDGMKDIDAFFRAFNAPLLSGKPAASHIPPNGGLGGSPVGLGGSPLGYSFATFLVPSNIRILLQFASDRVGELKDKLEFLETGAAPMAQADMLRLCELLPDTRLYNTYASTETGVVATYDYNGGQCLAGCLGSALPHSEIIIMPDGHIACKGDTLMSGYKDDEALTQTVLHDGALFTSDNGYLDDQGRLHLLGRDDDTINVGGYKLAPSEVEDVVLALPEIDDCICIAKPHPVLGSAPALLLVMKDGAVLNKRLLAQHIASRLERYKVPLTYTCVDHIERTFNGKLNRKFYRDKA